MTSLIAILIALLGYGSPSDYEGYTEEQLQYEIEQAEADQDDSSSQDDGGGWDQWDEPSMEPEPEP
jgi:surfactin synthase thioesterase subunit